jgi:hypothetical protein
MIYDYYETGLIGTLTLAADDLGLRHIGDQPHTVARGALAAPPGPVH